MPMRDMFLVSLGLVSRFVSSEVVKFLSLRGIKVEVKSLMCLSLRSSGAWQCSLGRLLGLRCNVLPRTPSLRGLAALMCFPLLWAWAWLR